MSTETLGGGRERAATILARSPGLVPSAIVCAVLLWFGGDEGGFRGTTWMPALLLLLAVLLVCLATLPRPRPARAALVAVLLLAGYAVWSLISIAWAGQEELAWDAGNRTILYALMLALCTLWPIRGEAAAVVLGALGLGIAAIALVELVKAGGAVNSIQYFHEARFAEPVGYTNGNVALWMLGLLPCGILGGRRGVPAVLRGLFLGSAVLLAGAALLGQSRGWLIVLPAVAVIAIVVVPGRGRTIVAFAAVGLALLPALNPLLDVYSDWRALQPPGDSYDSALRALLLSSIGLAMVGTLVAMIDVRVPISTATAKRVSAGVVALVVVAILAGLAGYAVVRAQPDRGSLGRLDRVQGGRQRPGRPVGQARAPASPRTATTTGAWLGTSSRSARSWGRAPTTSAAPTCRRARAPRPRAIRTAPCWQPCPRPG